MQIEKDPRPETDWTDPPDQTEQAQHTVHVRRAARAGWDTGEEQSAEVETPAAVNEDYPLTLQLGKRKLIIKRRYEMLAILNDFLIAGWYLTGSIMMLLPGFENMAVYMYIAGSINFLIRPSIRITRLLHLRKVEHTRSGFRRAMPDRY